jgi:hypothetical protein
MGELLEDNVVIISACNPSRTQATTKGSRLLENDLGREWVSNVNNRKAKLGYSTFLNVYGHCPLGSCFRHPATTRLWHYQPLWQASNGRSVSSWEMHVLTSYLQLFSYAHTLVPYSGSLAANQEKEFIFRRLERLGGGVLPMSSSLRRAMTEVVAASQEAIRHFAALNIRKGLLRVNGDWSGASAPDFLKDEAIDRATSVVSLRDIQRVSACSDVSIEILRYFMPTT